MPIARYFIVREKEDWWIRYGEDEFGPYKSQEEAMVFAVDAAKKLGTHGQSSEVCLMGENGHYHPEWISERDARPQEA